VADGVQIDDDSPKKISKKQSVAKDEEKRAKAL
jgi:hypothetical protein